MNAVIFLSCILFTLFFPCFNVMGHEFEQTGLASWYGPGHHGNRTASGERFDMKEYTAAHKTLEFGTRVKVLNIDNGRTVVVTINDRGPYVDGRIIDLSKAAAAHLGCMRKGICSVRIEIVHDK